MLLIGIGSRQIKLEDGSSLDFSSLVELKTEIIFSRHNRPH
jgi:hypothetical protein